VESFLELARARRSVRAYKPDPVPEGVVTELLEAARWAPSAINSQPWEFIVVTDAQVRAAVCESARMLGLRWPHIAQAPVVVVICAPRVTPFSRDDCIFAGANLMLAATDRGLGTCWIGGFGQGTIRKLLGIPEGFVVAGMCTVGYPAGETRTPPRRELAGMLHAETYAGGKSGLRRLAGPLEVAWRLLRLQLRRRGARAGGAEDTEH
jgi:nitroreductase